MRNVFRNHAELCHEWSAQHAEQPSGRAGNMSFVLAVLTSFRTPVARIVAALDGSGNVALFSRDRYSPRTSRQLSIAARAWSGNGKAFHVPHIGATGGWCRSEWSTPCTQMHAANVAALVAEYETERARYMHKVQRGYGTPYDSLRRCALVARDYARVFDIAAPTFDVDGDALRIEERFTRLETMRAQPSYQRKQERKAEQRERAKERARIAKIEQSRSYYDEMSSDRYQREVDTESRVIEQRARWRAEHEAAERVWKAQREERERVAAEERAAFEQSGGADRLREDWRADIEGARLAAHGIDCSTLASGSALLRLTRSGADVETSLRARVPVEHARRLFALLYAVRERGAAWETNGKTFHIGHFALSRIEPNGDFRAGCHFVEFAEVERFAARYGWRAPATSAATGDETTSAATSDDSGADMVRA